MRSSLLAVWFAAGPFVFGSALVGWIATRQAAWPQDLVGQGLVAVCIALALGIGLLHATVVCVLAGYLAGWAGLPWVVASYLGAVALGYSLGRWARPPWLAAFIAGRPSWATALERLRGAGWQTVAWARLSPILPFGIGNLALAWAGLPLPAVLVGSLLGMLPRSAVALYAGTQARSLQQALAGGAALPASAWWLAGLVLVAGLGLWRVVRKGRG